MATYFNYKQVTNVTAFKIFSEEMYTVLCPAHIADKPKLRIGQQILEIFFWISISFLARMVYFLMFLRSG